MVKEKETVKHIVTWLKDYLDRSGTKGFVIGISGGIDSAVTSTLCAMTGARCVLMKMPIHQRAEENNRGDEHIAFLKSTYEKVESIELDLTATYDRFVETLETKVAIENHDMKMLTYSNTRSRLRMTALYAVAGIKGMLVCGTGNKVEDFGVGFFTKYGDGGVDISPIADLTKTEVYQLGHYLGVPESILTARPTDGLWDDGRTDEDQIGATYAELEKAMHIHEKYGENPPAHVFANQRESEVWTIYLARHKANLHKMKPVPVCRIPDELKRTE